MALPFPPAIFTRQFEDGTYRPVKVYIQSNVDAGYVADLQRMVMTRGGVLAVLPKDADVIVIIKPDDDLGSMALELYTRTPSKPVVGFQWINECCYAGLLWGPDWGGHCIVPAGLPQPGVPVPAQPPLAGATSQAHRFTGQQHPQRVVKVEEPREYIDVDALPPPDPSPVRLQSDGGRNTREAQAAEESKVREAAPMGQGNRSKVRVVRPKPSVRYDPIATDDGLPLAGSPRPRASYTGEVLDEMRLWVEKNPEALFSVPSGNSPKANAARRRLWTAFDEYKSEHAQSNGVMSYMYAHSKYRDKLEKPIIEALKRSRLAEQGGSSSATSDSNTGRSFVLKVPRSKPVSVGVPSSASEAGSSSGSSSTAQSSRQVSAPSSASGSQHSSPATVFFNSAVSTPAPNSGAHHPSAFRFDPSSSQPQFNSGSQ